MISYGNLPLCRPAHLRHDLTETATFSHVAWSAGPWGLSVENDLATAVMMSVADPREWNRVCEALVEACEAEHVSLSPISNAISMHYGSDRADELNGPAPALVAGYHVARRPGFTLETPMANGSACGCLLNFDLDGLWLLRMVRGADAPRFNEAELARMAIHAAMLQSAAWSSGRMIRTALQTRSNVHDQLAIPYAVLDGAGTLLTSTPQFECIAADHFSLANAMPTPHAPQDAKAFKEALRALDHTDNVDVPLRHDTHPAIATLSLIPESKSRVSRSWLVGLRVSGTEARRVPPAEMLARLYGFTNREASVAASLAKGNCVSKIAGQHAVSICTIRVQLKAVFRKLGVSSQIELVSKLQGSHI